MQLPRYERKKASNALLAIQIAALLLLVPVAFVAGYALASNSKAPSTACPIALSRTGAKRQLSHDESATTQHLSAAGQQIVQSLAYSTDDLSRFKTP